MVVETRIVLVSSVAAALFGCASQTELPPAAPVASEATAEPMTPPGGTRVLEELTAEQIMPVIGAAKPRVKRACWQPALNSSYEGDAARVRVVARINIDEKGSVTNAQAEQGSASYPRLSSCIEDVLRSLRFPESAAGAKVDVPFVFGAR